MMRCGCGKEEDDWDRGYRNSRSSRYSRVLRDLKDPIPLSKKKEKIFPPPTPHLFTGGLRVFSTVKKIKQTA